jgi:hypothetical protein
VGSSKAATRGCFLLGGWSHASDGAGVVMFGHLVDALVDVVGGSESGTDSTTACMGLNRRD